MRRLSKRRYVFLLWVISIFGGLGMLLARSSHAVPNVLVILTDDQRWDTLWAMPIVQDKLLRRGVNFTQAFVSTPLCCPYRASFLGGGYYAHNTGVLTNEAPNGGAQRFVDTNTLPLRLQQHGYTTALIGKYLNGYSQMAPYVPPGWNRFVGLAQPSKYLDYEVVLGTSTDRPTTGSREQKAQYQTDYLRDEALAFLDSVGSQPFFLYVAFFAPHAPAVPAPWDLGLFAAYRYRSRGYGEVDLSDKPTHIRNGRVFNTPKTDTFHRDQLRSLQAVDRAVGALIDKLQALGTLENTVIVYTSDNGYLWGEHGLCCKTHPYDESIRVPLIMAVPGVAPREEHSMVVANVDVPTTIWHLAERPQATDGLNLLPLLHDPHLPWRPEGIFLENFQVDRFTTMWAGWRTKNYKYVEHVNGEKELYDLTVDSYELENVVNQAAYSAIVQSLAQQTAAHKGLTITTAQLPAGTVGIAYDFQIQAWGGTLPYTWSIVQGTLPEGLTFDGPSGRIQGVPVRSETQPVHLRVQDASLATQRREPQRFIGAFTLTIGEPGQALRAPAFLSPHDTLLETEDQDEPSSP